MEKFYETKYWEEVEENIKLQEEIDNLKWKKIGRASCRERV